MRRTTYFVALFIVGLSVYWQLVEFIAARLSLPLRAGPFAGIGLFFGSPLPAQLAHVLPVFVRVILLFVFAALITRRVVLLCRQRPLELPQSYSGWPYKLLVLSVASLALAIIGLAVSIALRAGSGVPAGLLAIPAVFLLAPVFFYVEARSWWLARAGAKSET